MSGAGICRIPAPLIGRFFVKSEKDSVKNLFLFLLPGHLINEIFDHLFFNIYIKPQHTDKGKFVEKIFFFFGHI